MRRVVTVLGKALRVRTNATEADLIEAAALLEDRARAASGGRPPGKDALLLAGLALAGELIEVQRQREALGARVEQLLERVESVLEGGSLGAEAGSRGHGATGNGEDNANGT